MAILISGNGLQNSEQKVLEFTGEVRGLSSGMDGWIASFKS